MNEAPKNSAGLWLLLMLLLCGLGVAFAVPRAKPPGLFAVGFGVALGLAGLLLAAQLQMSLRWPQVLAAGLFAVIGVWSAVLISAAQHYRKEQPQHALAEKLLREFPGQDARGSAAFSFGWREALQRDLRHRTHAMDPVGSHWLGLFIADGMAAGAVAMTVLEVSRRRQLRREPPQ